MKIAIISFVLLILIVAGCSNETKKHFYNNDIHRFITCEIIDGKQTNCQIDKPTIILDMTSGHIFNISNEQPVVHFYKP